MNVTEDELEALKGLLAERAAAGGDAARRYLAEARIAERVPALVATVERLRAAIWPGLPKWEPTAAEPQQDFHEAVIESWRATAAEAEQYRQVVQDGKRLPAPDLAQDPAYAAFVLGALEKDRTKLLAFKEYVHKRLDAAGVPADPDSPHKAEGCRIGGRLDLVLARWAAFEDLLAACKEGYRLSEIAVRQGLDFGPQVTEQIVRDHESLKEIRAALATARAALAKGGAA